MDALAPYSKALVAVVMALLLVVEAWTGWKSEHLTEEWVISILAILTPILVYFIPNSVKSLRNALPERKNDQ